jgi:hypothetical protein
MTCIELCAGHVNGMRHIAIRARMAASPIHIQGDRTVLEGFATRLIDIEGAR